MGERPSKNDPSLRQGIDLGSLDVFLAVTANPVRSQGIYCDEQNIKFGGMFCPLFCDQGHCAPKKHEAKSQEPKAAHIT